MHACTSVGTASHEDKAQTPMHTRTRRQSSDSDRHSDRSATKTDQPLNAGSRGLACVEGPPHTQQFDRLAGAEHAHVALQQLRGQRAASYPACLLTLFAAAAMAQLAVVLLGATWQARTRSSAINVEAHITGSELVRTALPVGPISVGKYLTNCQRVPEISSRATCVARPGSEISKSE